MLGTSSLPVDRPEVGAESATGVGRDEDVV